MDVRLERCRSHSSGHMGKSVSFLDGMMLICRERPIWGTEPWWLLRPSLLWFHTGPVIRISFPFLSQQVSAAFLTPEILINTLFTQQVFNTYALLPSELDVSQMI